MYIKVDHISKIKNRIEYQISFDVNYLSNKDNFFFEYPFNVENIPDSVAVIPLLGLLVPHSYITDTSIYVDEIDKDYYLSLQEVKNGYQSLYKHKTKLKGNIIPNKVVDNSYIANDDNNILLFSGGVDSFYTLLKNQDNINRLVYLVGAEKHLTDTNDIDIIVNKAKNVAFGLGKQIDLVITNFKSLTDFGALDKYYKHALKNYYNDLFHAHAYIGMVSVISYFYKTKFIYVSTSWGPTYHHIIASNPITDRLFRFATASVIHYGDDVERRDRIEYISNFAITYDNIHVCTRTGINCSFCEKCLSTMAVLDTLDKLHLYKNSFLIEAYKQNIYKAMSFEMLCTFQYKKYKSFYLYLDKLKIKYPNEYKKAKKFVRMIKFKRYPLFAPIRFVGKAIRYIFKKIKPNG